MRTLLLGLLVLASGCVGKKKYDAAMTERTELHRRVDGMNTAMEAIAAELAMAQAELERTRSSLDTTRRELGDKSAQNAELQAAVAELERRRAATEAMIASFKDLLARFKGLSDAGTLRVKVVGGRMLVELSSDILFSPGSASLSREGREAIAAVAKVLAEIPDREYQVAGHTDNKPIRGSTNWKLGADRAINVADLLVTGGLPPERVSAASYSEFRPADTNLTEAGRSANRRIEIVIVPDLSKLPGFEELEAAAGAASPAPAPAP